ncbi:MAG: hypothetical protein PUE08_05385 [Eubacteriales bacterium]|nr:hypothetical protein [Eubacteriales bacterium]
MNKDEKSKAMKNMGIDVNKMKQAADSGELDNFINENLSDDVKKKLSDVLSDKSKTEKLLSTPEAKELMKKFNLK